MTIILMNLSLLFMLLDLSIRLLDNIYSTGVTHDDRHMVIKYFYSIGHRFYTEMYRFCHKIIKSYKFIIYFTLFIACTALYH
jgi:hypothetical protein